jgi:GntR family transcriptional regulator
MADPMYRAIAEDLRRKIESGELGRGSQLPTELELRDLYKASRNTVRDAVKWLITRGLVETRPGQGTFVVEKIEPFVTILGLATGLGRSEDAAYASEVTARRREPKAVELRIEIHQATGQLAEELQLEERSAVVSRHQRRYIDDTPWSLQTTFYPMRLVEMGAVQLIQAEDILIGAVRYLEEVLGIKQVGWRDKITVRAPDEDETAFFDLPSDGRIAVFEIRRTAYDESGKPLRLTVTSYPADRNEFVVNVGKVPEESEEVAALPEESALVASSEIALSGGTG